MGKLIWEKSVGGRSLSVSLNQYRGVTQTVISAVRQDDGRKIDLFLNPGDVDEVLEAICDAKDEIEEMAHGC